MNITELKKHYEVLANTYRKEVTTDKDAKEITVKNMVTIKYSSYNELIMKAKPNERYMDKHNHLYVSIEKRGYFSNNGYYSYSNDETYYFVKLSKFFMQYWIEYAKLKKMDGVVFYTPVYKGNCKIIDAIAKELSADIDEEYVDMLLSLHEVLDNHYFLGGVISSEWKSHLNNYVESTKILKELSNKYPLLTLDTEFKFELLYKYFDFKFCGEELSIVLSNNFSTASLFFNNSKVFPARHDEICFTVDDFSTFLDSIKEELVFQNLLQQPMDNFKTMNHHAFKFVGEKIVEDEFNLLVEKLGSWDVVEEEMSCILQKYGIDNLYKQVILDVKGRIVNYVEVDLEIHEFSTDKSFYYFVKKRVGEKTTKTLHLSETEKPEFIQKEILELMLYTNTKL